MNDANFIKLKAPSVRHIKAKKCKCTKFFVLSISNSEFYLIGLKY